MSMPRNYIFTFILLLSGLSGISYEILYGRILGSILGDQFAVSASVLITFLLGIGLGARYAHRLWRWLWLIEASIGIYGILFALNTGLIDRLIYSGSVLLPGLAGSILLGTLLLLLPALLIGCSVPLFAGYLSQMSEGKVFSRVYAIYNVGAAATALLIEFWLIRSLGITGTVVIFGTVNLLAALLLILLIKPAVQPAPEKSAIVVPRRHLISLILVSSASAVFQLFMVKMVEMMFGPFRESFALVLTIILFGIAFGSFLVRRMNISYTGILLANVVSLLAFMLLFEPSISVYAALYNVAMENGAAVLFLKGAILLVLMGVPAVTFGATIPALLNMVEKDIAAESGWLLFVSSLANVAGFLLMVLVLHQYLDYGVQLLVVSALVVLALLAYQWRKYMVTGTAAVVLVVMLAVHHWRWDEDLLYLSYTSFQSSKDMKDDREKFNFPDKFKGYQDVFSINWIENQPYFFINGYISFPMNNPSEKIVGTIGPMFAPRAHEGLVLGLGAGSTASAVGLLFDHTDVVEINPVVRANQGRMARWNFDIEHNPNVNIIVDDAIHYAKASDKQYDMILNTVTTPLYFSSSKLYTKDFFDVIKRRLTKDGVYVTWLDSRIGSRGAEIIVNTLKRSFKHSAVLFIKSGYFLLIASDEPVKLQHPNLVDRSTVLKKDMMSEHERIPRLFAYNLMNPDVLGLVDDSEAPINTVDKPELEFEMAHLNKEGLKEFRQKLVGAFNMDEIRAAVEPAMTYDPVEHVTHVRRLLKESSITDGWNELGAVHVRNLEARVEKANLNMAREIAVSMDDAKSHFGYASVLLKHKQYDAALEEFGKVSRLEPTYPGLAFEMGRCYERKNQYDAALDAFGKAGKQDAKDPLVPYRLAGLYLKQKKFAPALAKIDRALTMQQDDYNHLRRGKILEAMGRNKDAVDAYTDAFNLNPKNEEVLVALNHHLAKW